MAQGTVKWFSAEKGYGFIETEGQRVEFDVVTGRNGKPQADHVHPL